MPGRRLFWIAALAGAALAPAAALAADEVVATGRAEPPPAATADDLLAQLDAIPNRGDAMEVEPPFAAEARRKPHGSMSVAIGTGGYRSVAGDVVIPVGETGYVGLGVELTEGRGGYYRHGRRGRR